MSSDSDRDLEVHIQELLRWLDQQQFVGVGARGIDQQGVRIHINPTQVRQSTKPAILARAGKVPVTFVEGPSATFQ